MTDAALNTPPPSSNATGWRPPAKSALATILICVVALAAVTAILAAWQLPPFAAGAEGTDNAYVKASTAVISPQVSGYVMTVDVKDYEVVAPGQVLIRIDDRIYHARVAQAKANLEAQIAALQNSLQAHASREASLQSQSAGLQNAQAQLLRSQADMRRADDLVKDGSISIREHDQTVAALRQAEAQVRQATAAGEIARQDIRTVDVGKGGLAAQVDAARAALNLAQIDLDHTVIRAPEAGQIGEMGVRLGQYVTNGTQLVSIVPPQRWVIANYKEGQIGRMAPGQRASITVDALAGRRFSGRIDRISPAAGSEFAVLKADNATGNFVKVPQRIGVRIVLDPAQAQVSSLRPGMSVEASIETRGPRP